MSKEIFDRLYSEAKRILDINYHVIKHTIAAAALFKSGSIYSSVNLRGCDYTCCSERIASVYGFCREGERNIEAVLSLYRNPSNQYSIASPCGNCRQFFIDYAPDVLVAIPQEKLFVKAMDLLPFPYISNFELTSKEANLK